MAGSVATPLEALASLAFGGVVSGGTWDLVKAGWATLRQRSWEDLYLDAFTQAFNDMHSEFERYAEGGEIRFDRSAFQKLLHQNLVLDVGGLSLSDATRDELVREIAIAIKHGNILVIGGHTLSDDSYAQLVRNLVELARATFREAVTRDTQAFRRAVLAESQGNQELIREVQALLEKQFDTFTGLLLGIDQRTEEIYSMLSAVYKAQVHDPTEPYVREQLGLRLTSDLERRLEELKEAWREGKNEEVKRELTSVKDDSLRWSVLEPRVKASYLRFEASTHVSENSQRATELALEARTLFPDAAKDAWLEAWLDHTGGDYALALGKLEGYNDLASVNFRAALLLEMDELAEAERVLRLENLELAPDAETYRIRALVGVIKKDLMQARRDAAEALALKPRWVGTCFCAAVVNYLSGVSPAVIDLTSPPIRIDLMFMKQDEDSRVRVGQAAAVFKELAEGAQDQPANRQAYEAWYLACLSHDPEHRDEAIAYCRSLLAANPRHHQAIRWVFANDHRDDIPLEASRASLSRLVREGKANVAEIVALVGCHLAEEDTEAAARVIDETRTTFESAGSTKLWQFWHLQLMAATGQTGPALIEINQATPDLYIRQARLAVVRKLAGKSGDWRLLSVVLEDSFEQTGDPAFLVEGCQLRAKLGDWQYVADRAQTLIGGYRNRRRRPTRCDGCLSCRSLPELYGAARGERDLLSRRKISEAA